MFSKMVEYTETQKNIREELSLNRRNMHKAEKLRKNSIKMEQQIIQWTLMLQELKQKIQTMHKHRGLTNKAMFRLQKDTMKAEIEHIVRDAGIMFHIDAIDAAIKA
jgi:hypothetical protein